MRPFDVLFTRRYALGGGTKVTGYDVLLRQAYKAALQGDIEAIKSLLKVGQRIEKIHGERHYPTRYTGPDPYVSAAPAMRLLGILVSRTNPAPLSIGLAPWVADALAARGTDSLKHHTCEPDEIADTPYSLHADHLYVPGRPRQDPADTHFKPGQSGNPHGRRKARFGCSARQHFLDELVQTSLSGERRSLTRYQVLLLQLELKAAKGDEVVRKLLLEAGLKVETERYSDSQKPDKFIIPDDVFDMRLMWFFDDLKRVKLLNPRSRKYHLMLPWIVELALVRLAPDALNDEEQAVVVRATSTPEKVAWPDWWGQARRNRQRLQRREGHVRSSDFGR